jgi:hypothetical protein
MAALHPLEMAIFVGTLSFWERVGVCVSPCTAMNITTLRPTAVTLSGNIRPEMKAWLKRTGVGITYLSKWVSMLV